MKYEEFKMEKLKNVDVYVGKDTFVLVLETNICPFRLSTPWCYTNHHALLVVTDYLKDNQQALDTEEWQQSRQTICKSLSRKFNCPENLISNAFAIFEE